MGEREWPSYRPDIELTAYWASVPLQATMAILDNLHERGDLEIENA